MRAYLVTFSFVSFLWGGSLCAQPPDRPTVEPGIAPGPPIEPFSLTRQYEDLIPGLLEAMGDSEKEVRQYAALAMAGLGDEAIRPLIRALDDSNNRRRAAAAYALGQMGMTAHTAIPLLLRRLKDEDPAVRRAAAEALSRMTTPGGVFEMPVPRMVPPSAGQGSSGAPALPLIAVPPPASVPSVKETSSPRPPKK